MDTQAVDRISVTRLIVFADDWGGHPSSCQHLVRHLLVRHPTIWVNTIGMRWPVLTRADAQKLGRTLGRWLQPAALSEGLPRNLRVIAPIMWPGLRWGWEQRLNSYLVGRGVRRAINSLSGDPPARRVALTTLPIAGAFLDSVDADAWVYYCVDDYPQWPGLDRRVLEDLEGRLLHRVGRVVAASATLRQRLAAKGCDVELLTHGADLEHWGWRPSGETSTDVVPRRAEQALPPWMAELARPIIIFWGLIDARLDLGWIRALQDPQRGAGGSLVLIGPIAVNDSSVQSFERVYLSGQVPYESLPGWAARADVLVMPYADLPVTRAMQPLKLKEYLATGKPVVVRSLPATREWADAADVVETAEDFVAAVSRRARDGIPAEQLVARRRLIDESWAQKAERFESILLGVS